MGGKRGWKGNHEDTGNIQENLEPAQATHDHEGGQDEGDNIHNFGGPLLSCARRFTLRYSAAGGMQLDF